MNALEFKEAAWLLMLIPFGIVAGTGLIFVVHAWRRARRPASDLDEFGDSPDESFGGSCLGEQPGRWLAVKTGDAAAVQAALNLVRPVPCTWEEGLMEAREDKLFISPPVDGWTIVIGSGLPGPFEDVDQCYHFLANLSRKLGEVQFFCSHRVVHQHAWVLMERGRVYRAYAWAGQTLWNQGPLTAAERELRLRCFDYCSEQNYFQIKDDVAANSERVGRLAARWSVNPGAFRDFASVGTGVVGALSQSRHF